MKNNTPKIPSINWEGTLPDETIATLNKPRYTIKSIKQINDGITYRKLNSWDSGGLISPFRDTEDTGWRRLSIAELIKLFIIADFKELGFENKEISALIKNLDAFDKNFTASPLEIAIDEGFFGQPSLLIIANKAFPIFLRKNENWESLPHLEETYSSISITLPFPKYINKVIELVEIQSLNENDPLMPDLEKYHIRAQEQKILELIKNGSFDEISITKADGKKERLIRMTTYKTGSFTEKDLVDIINSKDYLNLQVSRRDGKTISISQHETIKV